MAIKRSYTPYSALGGLAKAAGEADKKTKEAQMKFQMAMQSMQLRNQMELIQFKAGIGVEAQKRAHTFELEKLEIRSRGDLMRDEQRVQARFDIQLAKEIKEETELEQKLKKINDSKFLTPEEKENATLQVQTGIRVGAGKKDNPMKAFLANMIEGQGGDAVGADPASQIAKLYKASQVPTKPLANVTLQPGEIYVMKDGNVSKLPANQWPEAKKQGYTKLPHNL